MSLKPGPIQPAPTPVASRTVVRRRLRPSGRPAHARQVGGDGFHLPDALAAPGTPEGLNQLPAIPALRRVWARRFERVGGGGDRAFGLRQARHRGLVKTHLQHVATAAALDLDRVAAWLEGRPLAPTRRSRFAAMAA